MGPGDIDPPLKKTPPKHKETTSGAKGQIEHPNYSTWQTRTGLVPWFVNDTKGNEFIKAQHRTGTFWEMRADGVFKFVAAKNREDITYGKHVTKVTGAHDMTVDGDSSVKTEGSRRITTNGDSETTVKGHIVTHGKSVNFSAAEQFDVGSQSFTVKTKSALVQATGGPINLSAVGNAGVTSTDGSIGMSADQGSITASAALKVSVLGSEVHIKGGGGEVVMKDGKVYINSSQYQTPQQVWVGAAAEPVTPDTSYTDIT